MILSDPGRMTVQEHDDHCAMGHLPWRSSCESCISGMGKEDAHRRGKKKGTLSELAYDYAYVNSKDEERVRRGEKKPEDVTRLLIGKDSSSGAHFCHFIPRKGISHGSHNVDALREDIRRLTYNRLICKCDKEPSLVVCVKETQKKSNTEIVDEYSHTNDPQSNCRAERAVQTCKGRAPRWKFVTDKHNTVKKQK